ncbi:MAG: sigma-54 dependent transcriptional regulator [Verrucomicrobiota bacterium]|nr:sigma-54 dependent transcriptional regulator [Verrucomicrobiota bacterium]
MKVLIIDDETNIREMLTVALQTMGHETASVDSGFVAVKKLEEETFEVAFLDLRLGREDGLDVLKKLLLADSRLSVIVFTAFASIDTAVEAMKRGAADYIPKPFTPDQIRQVLAKIGKTRKLEGRIAELESRISAQEPPEEMTTSEEPAMKKIYEIAQKAAVTPASVLILGESGTGKSVLARFVHRQSNFKDNPFVTVSCPSLSKELLESELFGHMKGSFTGAVSDTWGKVAVANGGTLFLDEIGELPLEIQPKLLRLLQEKEYERVGESKPRKANVRVIAATNRNLEENVKSGKFREDLYYRLNVISVKMPSLRDRPNDLVKMAQNYLKFFSAQSGKKIEKFSDETFKAMRYYAWPGNLRELRNVVERAVILASGPEILNEDLPDTINNTHVPGGSNSSNGTSDVGTRSSLEDLEKEHIRRVLSQSASIVEAAEVLGIDPATLYRKRKKLAL